MKIIVQKQFEMATFMAAKEIELLIRRQNKVVLGLATGSTPLLLYQELIRLHQEADLDFSNVVTFNLDEYCGLDKSHPGSYYYYMHENFFRHINIKPGNVHIPNGAAVDILEECEKYEKTIASFGGIDLQVLGVGRHGHIGFNEPSSSLASRTRIKTLTEITRKDNALSFSSLDAVPHHVITMGVKTIMEAKQVILLASGQHKSLIIKQVIEGPLTAMVPGSILQMHPKARIYLNSEAASKLAVQGFN